MTNPLYVIQSDRDDVPLNADALHAGWTIDLPPAVKRHAIGAMRLAVGDQLQLSDGEGLRIDARIVDTQGGAAQVIDFTTEPRPVTRLALIQALAKTGHDTDAVDMATQIGVDEVIPWQAGRSIAKWKAGKTDRKWRQTLVSATEQSRRAWVPQLEDCISSKELVAICRRACVHGDLVVVLHQDATTTWAGVEQRVAKLEQGCLDDGKPRTIYVVVGPEGGISDEEVADFTEAGAEVCVLGRNIMRASTAGPVAMSLLACALGRFA